MRASLAPQPQWRTLWREPSMAKRPEVIGIDLAGVARHGLRHAEDVGAAGAQEACTRATCRCRARCCPRRSRRYRSATRGARHRAGASRRRNSRSRTSAAARPPCDRNRRPRRADLRARFFAAVERSGRLQMPKTLAECRCARAARPAAAAACASFACSAVSALAGTAARGEQRHLAGARDAVRRAEAGLHVFVAGIEIVRAWCRSGAGPWRALRATRARRAARRRRAVALRTSSDAGYDCQKFLTPTASPPETSPAKTRPLERRPPIASSQQLCGIGALLDGEAVGVGLHQLEIVPHRPIGRSASARRR